MIRGGYIKRDAPSPSPSRRRSSGPPRVFTWVKQPAPVVWHAWIYRLGSVRIQFGTCSHGRKRVGTSKIYGTSHLANCQRPGWLVDFGSRAQSPSNEESERDIPYLSFLSDSHPRCCAYLKHLAIHTAHQSLSQRSRSVVFASSSHSFPKGGAIDYISRPISYQTRPKT